MKKHKQGQSNSVILDHDASLQQLNDTLSLDNEPILSVNQKYRGSHGQGQNESKIEEGLFLQDNQNLKEGTFENFNSQLHLSGVMHHHNKDFAGETFS